MRKTARLLLGAALAGAIAGGGCGTVPGLKGPDAGVSRARNLAGHVDLFAAGTWEPGRLAAALEAALAAREDPYASGQWKPSYADPAAYRKTLGGEPAASYDPEGFLKELGLSDPKAAGRTDADLLRAWKLTDYQPDARFFPGPPALMKRLQDAVLRGARLSPSLVTGFDKLVTRTFVRNMEKADTLDPFPFGRDEDVVRGDRVDYPPGTRYAGIRLCAPVQRSWGSGIHVGSIQPDAEKGDRFGTYDIALHLGFTDTQARNIGVEDFDVDLDRTHYLQGGKTRITKSGSGGDKGDYHWHYNRSPAGKEDTRITGAKVHLDRAVRFAREGDFDAAEREIGIGLHGLQDIFSHGQITPICHALLAEFPDYGHLNPVGVFEAAVATEGYLRLYAKRLGVLTSVPAGRPATGGAGSTGGPLESWPGRDAATTQERVAPASVPAIRAVAPARPAGGSLVSGDAGPAAIARVEALVAAFPAGLQDLLRLGGVRVFVAGLGTRPTDLGFGIDLDGDGRVTPGAWADLNRDGARQLFEIEAALRDGRMWQDLPAGHDAATGVVFLSEILADRTAQALRHEIVHAADALLARDAALGSRWAAYRERAYARARRQGAIGFSQTDPAEHLADVLQ